MLSNDEKRLLAFELARELSTEEMRAVSGGAAIRTQTQCSEPGQEGADWGDRMK